MKNILKFTLLLVIMIQVGITAEVKERQSTEVDIYRELSDYEKKRVKLILDNTFVLNNVSYVKNAATVPEESQTKLKQKIENYLRENPEYKLNSTNIDYAILMIINSDFGKFYELYTDDIAALNGCPSGWFGMRAKSNHDEIIKGAKHPVGLSWDPSKYSIDQPVQRITAKYFVRLACKKLLDLSDKELFAEIVTKPDSMNLRSANQHFAPNYECVDGCSTSSDERSVDLEIVDSGEGGADVSVEPLENLIGETGGNLIVGSKYSISENNGSTYAAIPTEALDDQHEESILSGSNVTDGDSDCEENDSSEYSVELGRDPGEYKPRSYYYRISLHGLYYRGKRLLRAGVRWIYSY